MNFEQLKTVHDDNLMPTYGRFDAALVSGHGATAVGADGKEYIDFGSGIGVNALGYCEPGWVAAVETQLHTLQHVSNLYYNDTQITFAAALCAATGMDKAFLCNSGAEANECAIKLARKYSFDKYGAGRSTVVTLVNSFHGRTVTTLAATGQDGFHNYFFPFTGDFVYAEAGNLADLRAKLDGTVCAVLVECIQGEGGVIPLDAAYLQAVQQLCHEQDILLMADEVQTGAGRTGTFLACEQLGVSPDVVTMAKGLGGGLPIGACLCAAPLAGVMSVGMHGSTFGGNPVVCAGGLYMVNTLSEPAFLAQVRETGDYLAQRLAAMPGVREVRGLGMMRGLVLADGLSARALAEQCLQNGLLILTAKTLLRLLPPLNISRAELDKGLAILEATLAAAV